MTGPELKAARHQLGAQWGLGRPLTTTEMGEILGFSSVRPGDRVHDIERGHGRVTGPVALAVEAMLSGWKPEGLRVMSATTKATGCVFMGDQSDDD